MGKGSSEKSRLAGEAVPGAVSEADGWGLGETRAEGDAPRVAVPAPVAERSAEAVTATEGEGAMRVGVGARCVPLTEAVALPCSPPADTVAVGCEVREALAEALAGRFVAEARVEALPAAIDGLTVRLLLAERGGVADSVGGAVTEPPTNTRLAVGKGSQEPPATLCADVVGCALAERAGDAVAAREAVPLTEADGLPDWDGEEVTEGLALEGRERVTDAVELALRDPAAEALTEKVGLAEGAAERVPVVDAATVAEGSLSEPDGLGEGVLDPERDGERVREPDTVTLGLCASVRVGVPAAESDAEMDCVALRGSEKDCVPLLGGEPDSDGAAEGELDTVVVQEPPPRSAPGAAATVADTLLDARPLVRVAFPLALAAPDASGELVRVPRITWAVGKGSHEPSTLPAVAVGANTDGEEVSEEDAEGHLLMVGERLSRERVPVTEKEKVCDVERDPVPDKDARADLERDGEAVPVGEAREEGVPLAVASRAKLPEAEGVEDCEGDTLPVLVRVPWSTSAVGKGSQEPSTLPGERVGATERDGFEAEAPREADTPADPLTGSAVHEMVPDTVLENTTVRVDNPLRETIGLVGDTEAVRKGLGEADGEGEAERLARGVALSPDAVKLGEARALPVTALTDRAAEGEPP